MQVNLKRYGLYLFRWQLSTPILAAALYLLSMVDKVTATPTFMINGKQVNEGEMTLAQLEAAVAEASKYTCCCAQPPNVTATL